MTPHPDRVATKECVHVVAYMLKKQSVAEHKSDCNDCWLQRSELAEHRPETGPEIEWSQTCRFADYGSSAAKRKMREAIEIN
ncbi:unnamed protein product [Protopolystoma xenopodis]|uniref:Uncharacterized protein n=1 Tax=Protopolystoma xenopodis TaxID=117903 RepID=A0A3S5A9L0_9PLAT|nr:unnamed protein product [Protopolystoma xenopodis]